MFFKLRKDLRKCSQLLQTLIHAGKQMIKLDRAANGEKQTEALLQALSLEDVKKMIEEKT